MRFLIAAVLLSACSFAAVAQAPRDKYVRSSDATANVLYRYDTANGTCSATAEGAGRSATLVIQFEQADKKWIVDLTENDNGLAQKNYFYCVSNSDLAKFFEPSRGPDTGILAVPFKLRFGPVKVMAGSAVGPFIGRSSGATNDYTTMLAFAALTNVPLNDLNAEVPQTRWGVGFGAGLVRTVRRNFQLGVITGIDLFDGVEDWAYGYRPWVSVSVGFSFLSTEKAPAARLFAR